MTLNWDFTNYTFSFLISLLSAILGICHPLLLESILDDIIASGNVNPVIKLGKMIRVYQNDNAKFIRIRVKPDVDDSFELANMLQLSDYLK